MADGGRRWRALAQHLAIFILFCGLTAVMANGLVRDPAHLTIGFEGDNYFGMRQLWWMKHAIVDLHRSPYFSPDTYYPVGHNLAHTELFPATSILAIPFTTVWGPVVAYNAMMFLSFVLMGYGTFLWVRALTADVKAALVAGIIAAFLPYRFAHVLGHLDITCTQWMPWALFAFERFLARKTIGRAMALGLAFALVALSAWYYAYAVLLMLPAYAVLRTRPWRAHWDRAWWTGIAAAAATALVIALPFALPYISLRSQGGLSRSLAEMDSWSLNFYAALLPNRLNPWWSDFVVKWFPKDASQWVERGIGPGVTVLVLAGVGLVSRRKVPAIGALLGVGVLAYVIALGPTLHSGDRQVLLPAPLPMVALALKLFGHAPSLAPAVAEIRDHQALPVPLPALLLFIFVPLTSAMRVMSRFGIWMGLMAAGLAGWGVVRLLETIRRRGERPVLAWLVVAALSGLILLESYSRLPVMAVQPRAVDVWLGQQPHGDWAVIELPLEQAFRFSQDYAKTVHGQPTVFSSPADGFLAEIYFERRDALQTFPSARAIAMLRACHVRYVLLTPALIPAWPAFKAGVDGTAGLRFDREIDGVQVYRVD